MGPVVCSGGSMKIVHALKPNDTISNFAQVTYKTQIPNGVYLFFIFFFLL